jgi:hypothetical protein
MGYSIIASIHINKSGARLYPFAQCHHRATVDFS